MATNATQKAPPSLRAFLYYYLSGNPAMKALMDLNSSGFVAMAYGLFLGCYPVRNMPLGTWFQYHPVCMSVGMVGFSLLAIMIKLRKGRVNTVLHGYFMLAGLLFSAFGMYVIYTQKIMLEKLHFTSTHGQLGLVAFGAFCVLDLVGGALLHPDFGLTTQNALIRGVHKYSGRLALTLGWGAVVSGFIKMEQNTTVQFWSLVPLAMYFVKLHGLFGMSLDVPVRSAVPRAPALAQPPQSTSSKRKVEKKPPHAKKST
jgi:hypothetical protein